MMFEAYPDILTTKDLQQIFPKNRNAIYDLLKSGELPSFKLGREYMILKSDLLDFILNRMGKGVVS